MYIAPGASCTTRSGMPMYSGRRRQRRTPPAVLRGGKRLPLPGLSIGPSHLLVNVVLTFISQTKKSEAHKGGKALGRYEKPQTSKFARLGW